MITAKQLKFTLSRTKRDVFQHVFPAGAAITLDNAKRATRAGLSLCCAAEQLMRPRKLATFRRRADALLALYLENTAETRKKVNALNPWTQKIEWIDANEIHQRNKIRYWGAYLDGLAKAFVEGMK